LESSLGVIKNSEEFSSSLDCHNVLETKRVFGVFSHSVVNLDHSFLILHDLHHFLSTESVSQSVLQHKSQRDGLSQFVWPLAGSEGLF
jgi:hypothetical protein